MSFLIAYLSAQGTRLRQVFSAIELIRSIRLVDVVCARTGLLQSCGSSLFSTTRNHRHHHHRASRRQIHLVLDWHQFFPQPARDLHFTTLLTSDQACVFTEEIRKLFFLSL